MNKISFFLLAMCFCLLPAKAQESVPDSTAVPAKAAKKVSIAALPIISFDRSKGTGFGGAGMAFFKLSDEPGTKPSSVSVVGKWTTKNNWNASMMGQLYFAGDKYRLMFGGGYMNSNFQTYEQMDDANVEIPYNNHGGYFFFAPSIRVWNRLYVGIGGQMFKSHLDMDYPDPQPDSISTSWMNSLAINVMFDNRDSPYNPSKGFKGGIRVNFFPSWMENSDTYYKMHGEVNYYRRLDHNKILASRFAMNVGLGALPFVGQNYIGNRDIRGYTKGEYRGDQTYALQSELRWNFYKRWGAVGFFGLAMAATPDEDYTSPLLPAGGVGLRFMALPSYHINLGVDAAVGKGDWGLYFRISEAF